MSNEVSAKVKGLPKMRTPQKCLTLSPQSNPLLKASSPLLDALRVETPFATELARPDFQARSLLPRLYEFASPDQFASLLLFATEHH